MPPDNIDRNDIPTPQKEKQAIKAAQVLKKQMILIYRNTENNRQSADRKASLLYKIANIEEKLVAFPLYKANKFL